MKSNYYDFQFTSFRCLITLPWLVDDVAKRRISFSRIEPRSSSTQLFILLVELSISIVSKLSVMWGGYFPLAYPGIHC